MSKWINMGDVKCQCPIGLINPSTRINYDIDSSGSNSVNALSGSSIPLPTTMLSQIGAVELCQCPIGLINPSTVSHSKEHTASTIVSMPYRAHQSLYYFLCGTYRFYNAQCVNALSGSSIPLHFDLAEASLNRHDHKCQCPIGLINPSTMVRKWIWHRQLACQCPIGLINPSTEWVRWQTSFVKRTPCVNALSGSSIPLQNMSTLNNNTTIVSMPYRAHQSLY